MSSSPSIGKRERKKKAATTCSAHKNRHHCENSHRLSSRPFQIMPSQRCISKGCRKYRRANSSFCTRHGNDTDVEAHNNKNNKRPHNNGSGKCKSARYRVENKKTSKAKRDAAKQDNTKDDNKKTKNDDNDMKDDSVEEHNGDKLIDVDDDGKEERDENEDNDNDDNKDDDDSDDDYYMDDEDNDNDDTEDEEDDHEDNSDENYDEADDDDDDEDDLDDNNDENYNDEEKDSEQDDDIDEYLDDEDEDDDDDKDEDDDSDYHEGSDDTNDEYDNNNKDKERGAYDKTAKQRNATKKKKKHYKKSDGIKNDFDYFYRTTLPNFDETYSHLFGNEGPLMVYIKKNKKSMTGGTRIMIKVLTDSVYHLFASDVVDFLKKDLGKKFPIKEKTKMDIISFSVAPPASPRSNFWTTGSLHRDGVTNADEPPYFSVMVFIDEVTEVNGSIKFFKNSVEATINKKKPSRTTSSLESFSVTGPKGTVLLWDTRKLHMGSANKSNEYRTVLVFTLHSFDLVLSQDAYQAFKHEI